MKAGVSKKLPIFTLLASIAGGDDQPALSQAWLWPVFARR
jgi:hypothetical protein